MFGSTPLFRALKVLMNSCTSGRGSVIMKMVLVRSPSTELPPSSRSFGEYREPGPNTATSFQPSFSRCLLISAPSLYMVAM